MKKTIKSVAVLCLLYAILMLFIDGLYSLLSINQNANICSLMENKLIPYIISITSMVYCVIRIGKGFCWLTNSRIQALVIFNPIVSAHCICTAGFLHPVLALASKKRAASDHRSSSKSVRTGKLRN